MLALIAFPLVRAVAEASSSAVARDVVGVARAVGVDGALELAAVTVSVEEIDTLAAVSFFASVVRPRAVAAVRAVPEVAAVADTSKLLVAANSVGVVVAVREVVAGRCTPRVVNAASSTPSAVALLRTIVDVGTVGAVGAVPLVGAVARAASTTVARDVVGVAAAVEGVVAQRRAVGIATVAFVAGSAVVLVAEADRADAAVATVPGVQALALAVRVESADGVGVGGAVRVVGAAEAAVRIDTVVATGNVASIARVAVRRGEVDGTELAAIAVPLVRAVAVAIGNQAADVVGVIVAVGEVAHASTVGVTAVVFVAAVATKRVGVLRISGGVDVVRADRAVVAMPFSVALAAAARRGEVARDVRGMPAAVPVDAAQLVASRVGRLVVAIGAAIASS